MILIKSVDDAGAAIKTSLSKLTHTKIYKNSSIKRNNTWARVGLGHGNARPSILGHGARSALSQKKGGTVLRYTLAQRRIALFEFKIPNVHFNDVILIYLHFKI